MGGGTGSGAGFAGRTGAGFRLGIADIVIAIDYYKRRLFCEKGYAGLKSFAITKVRRITPSVSAGKLLPAKPERVLPRCEKLAGEYRLRATFVSARSGFASKSVPALTLGVIRITKSS